MHFPNDVSFQSGRVYNGNLVFTEYLKALSECSAFFLIRTFIDGYDDNYLVSFHRIACELFL